MQIKSRQNSKTGAAALGVFLAGALLLWEAAAGLLARAQLEIPRVSVMVAASLDDWAPWYFSGETRYAAVEIDGRQAIEAMSDAAASGLYRKISIDLFETPVIQWSWRVENTLGDIDETRKEGDDYPARVYVVVSHPLFFWRTQALTYVWSSAQPQGSDWPNAFADNVRVIAVRSGDSGIRQWHTERRNVREDFKRYFAKDARYIDAVAVMTDTDNTGKRAVAYYGDIYFSPP